MKRHHSGAPAAHSAPSLRHGTASLEYADIASAVEKRLFIGKVPHGTTEEELRSAFEPFGELGECRLLPDKGGAGGNGIGFVGFDTWGAAHRALVETDRKMQLQGHEGTSSALVVSFAERTSAVGRGGGLCYSKGLDVSRIFVGGLPDDATESELEDRFATCGHIEGCSLLPAKSRLRCGFVTFAFWGEAMDAVESLHGLPLRGGAESMSVVLAQPKDPDNTLRPLFESFGQLLEFRLVKEKGVLYASYSRCAEAQAAMKALSCRAVPGVSKSLNVKFSKRRGF